MSRRDATHFHQVFKKNWKVIMVILAFLVPPYGITWDRRRRKNIQIIVKGFPS